MKTRNKVICDESNNPPSHVDNDVLELEVCIPICNLPPHAQKKMRGEWLEVRMIFPVDNIKDGHSITLFLE